jgi:uncharacterized protein (DUF1810 family)
MNPLQRFHSAQAGTTGPSHPEALRELQAGRKVSHWIWYELPQLVGLGHSAMALRYGITDLEEAKAYLADPVLGPRLVEMTEVIAEQVQAGLKLEALLGELDTRKAVSSLTLFERAARDSAAPWIPLFLTSAGIVLREADAQGLPRCRLTLAKVEAMPPER